MLIVGIKVCYVPKADVAYCLKPAQRRCALALRFPVKKLLTSKASY